MYTAPIHRAMEVSSGATYEELRVIGRMNQAKFAENMRKGGMLYALQAHDEGSPKFNHIGHLCLILLTLGLWTPIYAIAYHYSARAKWYRKHNATQLMQARVSINRRTQNA